MNTLPLRDSLEINKVPIGHTWKSETIRASLWRIVCFALASGDWSRTHVNPFTSWLFKSNLGGLTFCIDFVLAMTKVGVYKIFSFEEETEVIARGYSSVVFKRPVRVGMSFYYTFTLLPEHFSVGGHTWRKWRFQVIDSCTDNILCMGVWSAGFVPVKRSRAGVVIKRIPRPCLQLAAATTTLVAILSGVFFIHTLRHPTWQEYLASLDPASRNTYLLGDIQLLTVIRQFGDLKLLKQVGTKESVKWLLDGP